MLEQKTIKVCMIIPPDFPVPAVKGGAIETLITNLVEQSREETGIQLTVCSRYDAEAERRVNEAKYKNVCFYWTNSVSKRSRMKNFLFRVIRKLLKRRIWRWAAHYGEVAALIQQKQFDLVIAEGGDYQLILDIIKDQYESSSVILHLHHHFFPKRSIAEGYGNLIGVSRFVADEYLKKCGQKPKSYVLKNCIDLARFDKKISDNEKIMMREKIGIRRDDFVVLYVGRIIEVKGVLELIQAVTSIADLSIRLLIVGSPMFADQTATSYMEKVIYLEDTYRDRVKITGYIPNGELYRYYQIADIQCVPSICEEAAPLVVLEGMVSGLPLIVTDSGGISEYVSKAVAVTVKRENLVENLREAIIGLKADGSRRAEMSDAAREHVRQYSAETYYNNFVGIIRDAAKKQDRTNE